MKMKSILQALDRFAGLSLITIGVSVLFLELWFVGRTKGHSDQSISEICFRLALSVLLVITGAGVNRVLRIDKRSMRDSGAPCSRNYFDPVGRVHSARCPKPITPSGPIHVLHIRDDFGTPTDCFEGLVSDEGDRIEGKLKRGGRTRRTGKSESQSSAGDDISLGGLLDLSTSVGDLTPMGEVLPSPKTVPDTIAAIWEAVPTHLADTNIWSPRRLSE
jgi:hypothetical protein